MIIQAVLYITVQYCTITHRTRCEQDIGPYARVTRDATLTRLLRDLAAVGAERQPQLHD